MTHGCDSETEALVNAAVVSAAVFNLLHAATHFATQIKLTIPSENFQSGICNAVVCTIDIQND